jgi:hypothetical protein
MNTSPLSRRTFLHGTGVALALPLLDSMSAATASPQTIGGTPQRGKQRMVAICTYLGMHSPYLLPQQAGRNYALTPYLEAIRDFRDDFTVFSGLSHPNVDGGHSSVSSFLTAAPHPNSSSFKNSISLDQFAAERMAIDTRFGYLALSTSGGGISWTRGGVRIPADDRPSRVFAKLFLSGSADEIKQQARRLREGQSIMDLVGGQARSLERRLGKRDRQKLAEYFSSVRDLELRLVKAEEWSTKPKPNVDYKPPTDVADKADFVGRLKLMFDLTHLALATDSTRLITLSISGTNLVPPIAGVSADWHNLSHHGKEPAKLEQLKIVELQKMRLLNEFLTKLKSTQEEEESLLDRTMVLFGSNLGNASNHDTRNLPILLAGGGFKHGQHLAFDPAKHPPLGNVFVSILQRLGIDVDAFASGTGTITGLD